MNSKKKVFLTSLSIITIFVLLITLFLNYFLITTFSFNKFGFFILTVSLIFFALILFLLLSKPLLNPLLESDKNLEKALKETIHELNIPVATIQLNAKALEKKLDNEKDKRKLSRVLEASTDLLHLYEQMEYSIKKEIGKIELQKFDLKETILISLSKFDDIKKEIEIILDIPDKLILKSDKNAFIKLIDNLISNAIKYNSAHGKIKINFENKILSIFNTGKSIDESNIVRVFDKYYQENHSKEGFGLGLTIVKEICDLNAIQIKISPKSEGTIVSLNLKNLIFS